ncbi:MAG: hypothetical protein GX295_10550 [Syntrophomonadaceae bacterium]|nr:hypothetical protein [Syntrophomonadaceae bacterium]
MKRKKSDGKNAPRWITVRREDPNRPPRFKQNLSGFSLVEVMAATLILVMVITPILQLFSYSILATTSSGRQFQAINYAQELMEILKANVSYQSVTVGEYNAATLYQLGITPEPPAGLAPWVTISEEDRSLGLYRVNVKVQWQVKQTRSVQLTTLVLRR